MDDLTNYLMNGDRHAALSPESLELMGKQAAARLLNENISLNESIAKLAGEHEDINGEQVKRICEFANNAVYLAKHDQSKTASAASSYPQFELADPGRIIQDLSDGARPTVVTPVDVAYSQLPQKAKTSSRDDVLERVFGEDIEKKASVEDDYSVETIVNHVINAKHELVATKEALEANAEKFSNMLKEAEDEHYNLSKQHLMDGHSFADVLAAAQSSGFKKDKIAEALRPTIERLIIEKVATPLRLKIMSEQLEKVAHRQINSEHALVKSFNTMLDLRHEIDVVGTSLETVDSELSKIAGHIKEMFVAGKTH